MAWKDRLTPDELAELRRAEKVRDDKRDMYNANVRQSFGGNQRYLPASDRRYRGGGSY